MAAQGEPQLQFKLTLGPY
ncbi:hypothetical protein J1605_018455 [Eschrichtius robustus]|uniref:Uncharacterized protein n=1 Tax=Eschrichtius robustus TaxID=9764 RepID=A0AB34HXD0_ESCRO|nr:hypothetical protein J1605_018455 [Eschrichtius robustus]